ncbi:hypothetical protein D9M69_694870 [compost metagenome]
MLPAWGRSLVVNSSSMLSGKWSRVSTVSPGSRMASAVRRTISSWRMLPGH